MSKPAFVFVAIFSALSLMHTAVADQSGNPQELVERVTSEVLAALRQEAEQSDNAENLGDNVLDLILPHFDFVVMSKLVLGKHWRRTNQQQREQFVAEFRRLLVRTYETSLIKYRDEQIKFLPFRKSDQPEKKAVVRSEFIRSSGPIVPIHYSLRYKPDDGWKVYDIVVEGVSLVTNYRSSFAREISRSGIDHLVDQLRDKNSGAVVDNEKAKG